MNDKKLRSQIRTIIRENRAANGSSMLVESDANDLYNAFIAPFADVVKAGALASQDMLNSMNLIFKSLITLSPKRMEAIGKEYDARKAKIDAKWKPIMDGADLAIGAGDAALIGFVTAPSLFLGAALGKGMAKTPKNVAQYLNDTGWTVPLSGLLGASVPKGEPREKGLIGKGVDIAKQMLGLFYIESYVADLPILYEAPDEPDTGKKEGGIKDFEKELAQHFADIGLDEAFEDGFNEIYEAKKEQVDAIMEMADAQLAFLTGFAAAETLEEMQEVLAAAEQNSIDTKEVAQEVENLKKDLDSKASELKDDEKFKKDLEKTKMGEDLTDSQIQAQAEEASLKFANETIEELKSNFLAELEEGIPQLKEQVLEEIMKDLPEEGSKEFSAIASSQNGKKYLDLFKAAKEKVNSYNISGLTA